MRVALVTKPGHEHTGIGRYNSTLLRYLSERSVEAELVSPVLPPFPDPVYSGMKRAGMDLRSFFSHYPVWIRYPRADVFHLTGQNLASLLQTRRPGRPVIVTVHDILPYMLADQPDLTVYRTAADRHFDALAMRGLGRADHLVADSHYTRTCLSRYLGIRPDRVTVAYPGIDHTTFRPVQPDRDLLRRYGLQPDSRYLIYVGSNDPRKNLHVLVEALALIRATHPDVELLKVGRAQYVPEHQQLLRLAGELGVRQAIHFIEDVPDEDLPALYSLARACVFPSLYEGFGFPVLEAMACGTPVVSSSATSLAELCADAALTFDPANDAPAHIATHVRDILGDPGIAAWLSLHGRKRAAEFRWDDHINILLDVYRELSPAGAHRRLSKRVA